METGTIEDKGYFNSITVHVKDEANVVWHLLLIFLAFYIIRHVLTILSLILTLFERIFGCFGRRADFKVQVVLFCLLFPLIFADSNLRLYSEVISANKDKPAKSFVVFGSNFNFVTKRDVSSPFKDFNSKIFYNFDFENQLSMFCSIDSITDDNCIIYSFGDSIYYSGTLKLNSFEQFNKSVYLGTTKLYLNKGCSNYYHDIVDFKSLCGLIKLTDKNFVCQNLIFDLYNVLQDVFINGLFTIKDDYSKFAFVHEMVVSLFYSNRWTTKDFNKQLKPFIAMKGGQMELKGFDDMNLNYFTVNVCQFYERIIKSLFSRYFILYPDLSKYGDFKDQVLRRKFSFHKMLNIFKTSYSTVIVSGETVLNYTQENTKRIYVKSNHKTFCLISTTYEFVYPDFRVIGVNGSYLDGLNSKFQSDICYFVNHLSTCYIICEKNFKNNENFYVFGYKYPSKRLIKGDDSTKLHFESVPFRGSLFVVGLNYKMDSFFDSCMNLSIVFDYHSGIFEIMQSCPVSISGEFLVSPVLNFVQCSGLMCIPRLNYLVYFLIILILFYPFYYFLKKSIINVLNLTTSVICMRFKIYSFNMKKFVNFSDVRTVSRFYKFRLFLMQYCFVFHFMLQILFLIFLIPFEILNYLVKRKIVLLFPLTFYFGNVNAVRLEGYVKPCVPFNDGDWCDEITGYHYANESEKMLSDSNDIRPQGGKLDLSHLHCEHLTGLKLALKNDEIIQTTQHDSETLISENCEGDRCWYERVYNSKINIYMCNKLIVKKKDKTPIIFVIDDINDFVRSTTLYYYGPLASHENYEPMTCGHSLCTDNLLQLNKPSCKENCFTKLGCEGDDWQDSECFSNPFRHVFVKNNLQSAFRLYNTGFQFSCSTSNLCYSPKFNIYGTTKREVMHLVTYKESVHTWFFALLKLGDLQFSTNVAVISDGESRLFKISSLDENFSFDRNLKFEIDIDWNEKSKDVYILVGFDRASTGLVSRAIFTIDEPEDVFKFFGHKCLNGITVKGIDKGCSFRENYIQNLDVSFDVILSKLRSIFREITVTDDFGYTVKISRVHSVSDSSLDPTLKNNIKSEFVSYPLFNNDKITYQKVDFGVFRHFLNFGKMKIKVVSRESFVKQHVSRDVVKLKFLNCSGHNFDINGFEVCFRRMDKSTLPMMIKCGTFLEDLTVIGIPPENKDICHVFSNNVNTKVKCKQVSPIVNNDDVFEFNCDFNFSKFENRKLSPHIRSGQIPKIDAINLDYVYKEFMKTILNVWDGFGYGFFGFLIIILVVLFVIIVLFRLFL